MASPAASRVWKAITSLVSWGEEGQHSAPREDSSHLSRLGVEVEHREDDAHEVRVHALEVELGPQVHVAGVDLGLRVRLGLVGFLGGKLGLTVMWGWEWYQPITRRPSTSALWLATTRSLGSISTLSTET